MQRWVVALWVFASVVGGIPLSAQERKAAPQEEAKPPATPEKEAATPEKAVKSDQAKPAEDKGVELKPTLRQQLDECFAKHHLDFMQLSVEAESYLDAYMQGGLNEGSSPVSNNHWLAKLDFPGNQNLAATIALEGDVHSTLHTEREYVDFDQAYVTLMEGPFDLRVGKQLFAWGSSFGVSPTDVLNPWDYNDYLRRDKIGVYAARARYMTDKWTLEGTVIPTLHHDEREYFPFYVTGRLPTAHSRWYVPNPTDMPNPTPFGPSRVHVDYIDHGVDPPTSSMENTQYAVRFQTSLWDWDVSVGFFNGWYNVPRKVVVETLQDTASSRSTTVMKSIVDRQSVTTLALAKAYGDIVVRAEGAYFDRYTGDPTYQITKNNYGQYVVGFDYTGKGFAPDHEIQFGLQWVHVINAPPVPVQQNPLIEGSIVSYDTSFRHDILPRLTYKFSEDTKMEGGFVLNTDGHDSWWYGKFVHQFTPNIQCEIGFDILDGSRNQFFGQYKNNDRIWFCFDFKL